MLVHFNADEIESKLRGSDGRAAEAEKRVHREAHARKAVEPETIFGHTGREGCRVGTILVPVLNRVVRDEPGVPPASQVATARLPAADVRSVLVGNTNRTAVERRSSLWREMKDELVAVVHEARAVDRLVVTDRNVLVERNSRSGCVLFNRDGLDPVDRVLELQVV